MVLAFSTSSISRLSNSAEADHRPSFALRVCFSNSFRIMWQAEHEHSHFLPHRSSAALCASAVVWDFIWLDREPHSGRFCVFQRLCTVR